MDTHLPTPMRAESCIYVHMYEADRHSDDGFEHFLGRDVMCRLKGGSVF